MSRPIAVLRPEPGNRVTAAVIESAGRTAIRLPLFEARPMAWEAPDPADFDALIITSANAMRHGGKGLAQLRDLPVHAVGEATAEAARRAGFRVAAMGSTGSAELIALAEAAGVRRALHLAGRERTVEPGGIVVAVVTVYATEPIAVSGAAVRRLGGSVVLVQSARTGERFAEIVDAAGIDRATIALVAIGRRAAAAAGTGWETVLVPPDFAGTALTDAAIALAD
ncbi:MAG: uroporphyrinogen-III synthase [Pseudomonadota bacterium]